MYWIWQDMSAKAEQEYVNKLKEDREAGRTEHRYDCFMIVGRENDFKDFILISENGRGNSRVMVWEKASYFLSKGEEIDYSKYKEVRELNIKSRNIMRVEQLY